MKWRRRRDGDQLGLGVHHLGENEVPGRVDEVEEQDRQADQQKVAIAEDQRESAAFVARLASVRRARAPGDRGRRRGSCA